MTLFLDLPREIRELIYDYIFLSPKSSSRALVSFLPNYKSLRGKTVPSFDLLTNPIDVFPSLGRRINGIKPIIISLSIVRVCRQTYEETHGRFWAENTLYFPDGLGSTFRWRKKRLLSVCPTLKAMGQIASRFITNIYLDMSAPTSSGLAYHDLSRVLNTLASRSRHGHFKCLELSWLTYNFSMLLKGHAQLHCPYTEGYAALLHTLENSGTDACKYERVIRFDSEDVLIYPNRYVGAWDEFWEDRFKHMDAMAMEMNVAFGGKLYWGEALGWEHGVRKLSAAQAHKALDYST